MKKIIFMLAIVSLFVCMLSVSVSAAEPSYKDGEWIYAADGTTKLAIRDTDGNPLIWYNKGSEIKWVRADQTDEALDVYVKYNIGAGGSGFDTNTFNPEKCLKSISIFDNGEEIICSGTNLAVQNAVLINLERLDIDALNGWLFGNKNGCCPLLRGIVLPSTLKGIGQEGFTNTKLVQIWNLENTQLFYINACDFASTKTLTQEATNGIFKLPKTLMRPLAIQNSQVKTYIMNPNFDYPSLNQKFHQFFRDCPKLQEIYCPAQANIGFGEEAFRGTPAQYVVFITGTEQDATGMRDNTQDRVNNWDNAKFRDAEIISYDKYLSEQSTYDNATNKVYIVYGYNYCEAFYDGVHKMSGSETISAKDYFAEIEVFDFCTREECANKYVTKKIDPIFVNYGYSMTEVKIGNKLAMSQFFGINDDNLKEYTDLTGESFEYGIVVSSNADPLNEANVGLIEAGKTHITKEDKIAHDYIIVSVAGFVTEGEGANADKGLAFCMFVKDGEKTSYLDNGKTVTAVELKSYNTIKAMLENN